MKLKVEKTSCIGCGLCTSSYDDILALGDDGFAEVITKEEIDAALAKEVIGACPVDAIKEA